MNLKYICYHALVALITFSCSTPEQQQIIRASPEALVIPEVDSIVFKCQPCGIPCDTIEFHEPGICPVCNMPLFASYHGLEPNVENPLAEKKVAVLVFPGVQIIDFTGPFEVFQSAGCNVFTVAKESGQLATSGNLQIVPDYTFDNWPGADILVVPGGNVNNSDTTILNWIKSANSQSERTLSVCNGTFFLSSAGLLDGLTATTTFGLVDALQEITPTATIVDDQRYIDSGHIITSAGLSSGIDGALYLVSQYLGEGRTRVIANSLELNWNLKNGYTRGLLADRHILRIRDVFSPFERSDFTYGGNTEEWELTVKLQTDFTIPEIMVLIDTQLIRVNKWTKVQQQSNSSRWQFSDQYGKVWTGQVIIADRSSDGIEVAIKITQQKDDQV